MSKTYKIKGLLNYLLLVLLTFGVVKLLWSIVDFIFLPSEGVNITQSNYKSSLYTPFKLALSTAKRKAPVKKIKRGVNLRMLTLVGLYRDNKDPKKSIAIISKGGMPKVVSVGENIFGFELKDVKANFAILQKGDKEYSLELPKNKVDQSSYTLKKSTNISKSATGSSNKNSLIKEIDGQRIVPRRVIREYSRNMRKIWQNISLSDYKKDGSLKGFKVRFVRKGSLFDQLGLRQGDIITGINGEPVKDYSLPMKIFSNINGLDNLILQVKRGNNEVELEYEIR